MAENKRKDFLKYDWKQEKTIVSNMADTKKNILNMAEN